jgi:voltage-gated potassium channel
MVSLPRRILPALYVLVIITGSGVAGYMIIEHWSFLDALYMTIRAITTAGYGEVYPLSQGGKVFSIVLLIGGVVGVLYALGLLMQCLLEGQLGITLRRRRMKTEIAKLKEHFILCGYGRMGREIANTFNDEGIPFVVIENSQESAAMAGEDGYLYLQGDATNDEVLKEARIESARGLVAAVGSDVDNTYITLSARGLCPDLLITARSCSPGVEVKLKRAGANCIVSPHSIGARRMAMLALHPAAVDLKEEE